MVFAIAFRSEFFKSAPSACHECRVIKKPAGVNRQAVKESVRREEKAKKVHRAQHTAQYVVFSY